MAALPYTQSPHLSSKEIDAFLEAALVARLCTLNRDGTIHAAPVWYLYQQGKIVIGTPKNSRKATNIRRDNRVTVLVDVEGPPTRGVVIYGKAEIMDLDGDQMVPEAVPIFRRYMSEEEALVYAKGLGKISSWVKLIVHPEKTASFDYGKDELYRKASKGQL